MTATDHPPVKAGELLMVDIPGLTLDDDTARYLQRTRVQGVCLFLKNVETESQLRQLCSDLRDVMGPHALIAMDHEGGAITRPTFWPFAPSAMSLGMTDDPNLTERVNAALARQLRSVGINWNFTPCLDVNVDPRNPVIGERAFGADPKVVTRHGRAALRGHVQSGVAPCAKHFPGHGDTSLDSHLALPTVRKPRAELDLLEFAPFRELVSDTPALMTAHILYPALDPEHPATLSRLILTDLLRTEWGFDGVVITDSMGMQAIDARYGRGEAAVASVHAGADMVMALGRREVQEQTLQALQVALDAGVVPAVQAARSRDRLRQLARRFPAQADQAIRPEGDAELMQEAWSRGLRAYRKPVPPRPGTRITLVAHRDPVRENVSEAAADADTLARELAQVYDVQLSAFDDPAAIDWAAVHAAGHPVVLASTFRHRQPAFREANPTLHLALYNPFAVLDVDAPAIVSFGFRPEARAAVLEWLRGERDLPSAWSPDVQLI